MNDGNGFPVSARTAGLVLLTFIVGGLLAIGPLNAHVFLVFGATFCLTQLIVAWDALQSGREGAALMLVLLGVVGGGVLASQG